MFLRFNLIMKSSDGSPIGCPKSEFRVIIKFSWKLVLKTGWTSLFFIFWHIWWFCKVLQHLLFWVLLLKNTLIQAKIEEKPSINFLVVAPISTWYSENRVSITPSGTSLMKMYGQQELKEIGSNQPQQQWFSCSL